MAFASGINGKLYWGNGTASATSGGCEAKVTNWGWTVTQEVLPTTTLCDTDQTNIPSTRTTTGTCTMLYYGANSDASRLIQKILKTGSAAGDGDNGACEPVTFKLQVNNSYVTIAGWITSAAMTCAVGEVVKVDLAFTANGAALDFTL